MGIGSITSAAQRAAAKKAAAKKAAAKTGKGATDTFKGAGDLAEFGTQKEAASKTISQLHQDKNLVGFQEKMAGKDKVKKTLTTKQKNALERKKQLKINYAKKRSAEEAELGGNTDQTVKTRKKKQEIDSLEGSAGMTKGLDDTTQFDKEIAEAIETMKAAFKREAANKK